MKGKRKRSRQYELERIGNARAVQLYVDGFESLTKREKLFAYHLARAAIAGRLISIDQTNRFAVEIIGLCQEVLSHPKGVPSDTLKAIHDYAKLFWINNGMYDYATARKFVPSCTIREFKKALRIAARDHKNFLEAYRDYFRTFDLVERAMFDQGFMSVLTEKSPGLDFISESANNFYEGLTTKQVEDWAKAGNEKNPLNSKVIWKDGKLEEVVWRAGGGRLFKGMYARELTRVIASLKDAKKYASGKRQACTIEILVKFLQSGDLSDWQKFNINWVKDRSRVDFILGFIEVYMDPRGQKGKFESVVYFTNRAQTKLMRKLASNARYFENRAPWNNEYKNKNVKAPLANVVDVIVETGDAGPVSAIGINLPNEQRIRQDYGSKSILLHNVVAAYNASEPEGLLEEFCFDEAEVTRARKYRQIADDLHTAMHEVLGHASGKVSKNMRGDPAGHLPGYYSTLEEARADLVALWNAFDPKLRQLKLVEGDGVGKAMYDAYVRNVFLQLRRIPTGDQLEEDHMKNRQLVVNYVIHNSTAIEIARRKGKTYFHIRDYAGMRETLGKLLAEVMRIKAEGDLAAAGELVDVYGLKINQAWRDELLRRVKKFNLSSYTGFVMPDLRPVFDKKGKLVDVKVEYPLDLTKQMLEYSKFTS